MKIAHITSEKGWRGGERQLYFLITELQKSGIENILICNEESEIEKRLHDTNIPHHHLVMKNPLNPVTANKLRKVIDSLDCDVLHLHTPTVHTLAVLAGINGLNIPMVLHRRTYFPIKNNPFTQFKYKYKGIKRIICISAAIKYYVDQALKKPEKSSIIHDGINISGEDYLDYSSSKDILIRELGLTGKVRFVGNISALSVEKGYGVFVSVAEEIHKILPDVHFLIIGKGDQEQFIRNIVEQKSLSQNVHFLGFRDDLERILPGLDALLMPSIREGLGTAILDAFLARVPVVSTRVGGIPELVMDEKTGLISDPDDFNKLVENVLRILNDQEFANDLRKNAFEHVRSFSKERMAEKTASLYAEVTGRKENLLITDDERFVAVENSRFSILIPTWNNLEYLKCCIDSIIKNSHFRHQILVHINDGSDGSLEWVKSRNDLSYKHSNENVGICWALNGLRPFVDTDYILYINDDMYVCPDWDLELMKEIESFDNNRFFLSSTVIEPHTSHYQEVLAPNNFGTTPKELHEQELLDKFRDIRGYDWLGATWPPNVVHREVWDLVGGYSIEFSPGFYSDPDFSMKLWNAGIRNFKGVNKSRVYHFGSKSTNRIKLNEGGKQFLFKWGITSSTFIRFYLRRGAPFNGLPEPGRAFNLGVNKFRSKVKKVFQSMF